MGIVTDVIQDAIKTKEPVPDCIVLLAHNDLAVSLADVWRTNAGRAKILMSRGRSPRLRYLKELSVWQFSQGTFSRLFVDTESTTQFDFDMSHLLRSGLARIFHQQQVGGLVPKRVFIGM